MSPTDPHDPGMTRASEPEADCDPHADLNTDAIVAATVAWLEDAVIGLNLCPFAKAVHRRGQIRYVVSAASDTGTLATDLEAELRHLQASDPQAIDTTLLIHPRVLTDFFDYNAYLPAAERIVKRLGLRGVIQVASFHPEYVFADSEDDAIDNYTNRSPYPMLHLLREDSIDRAVAAFPQADAIYDNNIATLRRLGLSGWQALGCNQAGKRPVDK
jgi:hypothetical protein